MKNITYMKLLTDDPVSKEAILIIYLVRIVIKLCICKEVNLKHKIVAITYFNRDNAPFLHSKDCMWLYAVLELFWTYWIQGMHWWTMLVFSCVFDISKIDKFILIVY